MCLPLHVVGGVRRRPFNSLDLAVRAARLDMAEVAPPRAAWVCVQAVELLRRTEELVLDALTGLGSELHSGIRDDVDLALNGEALSRLLGDLAEVAEVGERLRGLGERLPHENLRITYADVHDGAAEDLAEGIMDESSVRLAARVLDVPAGWRALAEALLGADVRFAWRTLTPGDLLSRFRGADPHVITGLLAEADIPADASFAECDDESIARLGTALLQHVER